ncbi:O-antigen ligase family protein [Leptospira interrogans]
MATLFIVAALLLVVAPMKARDRAAFYLIAVPAVPVFISAPLPFPGINYLLDVTHIKLVAIVLLIPILLSRSEPDSSRILNGTTVVLLCYIVYSTFLIVFPGTPVLATNVPQILAVSLPSSPNITGGLRFLIDQLLCVALPYAVIVYTVRKTDDIDTFLKAFLIASIILAIVALISRAKAWDIYGDFNIFIREIRDGGIRINATAGTHSLAFHLAAAFMGLEYLRQRISIGWIAVNSLRVIFVAAMLTTDSRGALGGLVVAWCVYKFLMLRSMSLRLVMSLLLTIAVIGGIIWLAQGDVDVYDEHGTFSYRQELIWTSVEYITKFPIFGDRFFLQSGAFDHLLQGQGIIDITNLYLQVALTFGLLGLAMFAFVFVLPAAHMGLVVPSVRRAAMSKPHPKKSASDAETWSRATAVIVAIIAGWLFLVATTSDVGLTLHLGVVFAALCNALRRLRPLDVAETKYEHSTGNSLPTAFPA